MSDTQVPNRLSSLRNLRKPARKRSILKGTRKLSHRSLGRARKLSLVAVLVGAVLISIVTPATTSHAATGQKVTIERVGGKFVVQGWGFAANTKATVWATLGSLSGKKTAPINSTGYFWATFYKFTSDHTGSAWAKATDPKGGSAETTRQMGSSDTASFVSGKLVEDGTASTPTQAPSSSPTTQSGWNLAFDDEFNGSSVNTDKWGLYDGTGNKGIGTRSPSAVHEGNGELGITGHDWVGGGIGCYWDNTYGKYEMRFKFDKGSGYNTAFLLWPSDENWPAEGEIDLGEMFDGDATKYGTFDHWYATNEQTGLFTNGDFSQWHTIVLDWEQSSVTWTLDGKQIMSAPSAGIPHTNHFMGIQLDVSSDSYKTNGETLHVDYVRIYKHS